MFQFIPPSRYLFPLQQLRQELLDRTEHTFFLFLNSMSNQGKKRSSGKNSFFLFPFLSFSFFFCACCVCARIWFSIPCVMHFVRSGYATSASWYFLRKYKKRKNVWEKKKSAEFHIGTNYYFITLIVGVRDEKVQENKWRSKWNMTYGFHMQQINLEEEMGWKDPYLESVFPYW